MFYFKVEVTDPVGFVVFDETYCSYHSANKCFDEYLSSCDSLLYEVHLTVYMVSEDLEDFDYPIYLFSYDSICLLCCSLHFPGISCFSV